MNRFPHPLLTLLYAINLHSKSWLSTDRIKHNLFYIYIYLFDNSKYKKWWDMVVSWNGTPKMDGLFHGNSENNVDENSGYPHLRNPPYQLENQPTDHILLLRLPSTWGLSGAGCRAGMVGCFPWNRFKWWWIYGNVYVYCTGGYFNLHFLWIGWEEGKEGLGIGLE